MSSPADPDQAPMTFDWPARPRSSWLLAGLIFLSLFFHALAFLLIQSPPPRKTTLPRPAPTVGLISRVNRDGSYSRDNDILLNWVQAQDPALIAQTPELSLNEFFDLPYRPSYQVTRTMPRGVPTETPTLELPSPKPVLELITDSTRAERGPQPLKDPPAGSVTFSATLKKRAPQIAAPAIPENVSLQASPFLIGVSDRGEVRFVFPQGSSGSAEADAIAQQFVSDLKFNPGPEAITWGTVEILCRTEPGQPPEK